MKRINILCCTDDKYAPLYGIMLTSLFDTNPEVSFNVYFLSSGLSQTTRNKYDLLCAKHFAITHYITINEKNLKNCPIRKGDHVTLAAYYRILAPVVLPKDINRVLYLDGDIIINGSILDLWNTNIEGYALGAVIDEAYHDKEKYERLKIDSKFPYINSGVLLINLDYWRQHDVVNRCLECIEKMHDVLLHHDQDTLNIILHNEIKLLQLTYNYQYGFIMNFLYEQLDDDVKKEVMVYRYNPIVIHFSGPYKPWQKRSKNPYAPIFLYYRKHSLWKDLQLIGDFTWSQNLRYYLTKFIWWIGIKKEFNSYIVERQFKKG